MTPDDHFRALFERTYPQVVAYARRRTPSVAEADDVVAEVYATAWRKAHDLESIETPLAWLYGIGLNVIRNRRRAAERHLRLVGAVQSSAEAAPPPGDPADAVVIRQALDSLPDDDAELLRLIAWEGLSYAEAGAVLGCTASAVGSRLHRARQRLDAALSRPSSPRKRASNA